MSAPTFVAPEPTHASAPLRVLLIDDDPHDRVLARRALHRDQPGIQTIEPAGASSFESLNAEGGFDAVITDYSLAWSNGLSVAKAVKARWPDCPVIIYTGTGNEAIAVDAMKLGVDDYVIKRATPAGLGVALRNAVARAGDRQRTRARAALVQGMLETAVDAVIVMNHEGRIVDFNPSAERMFGYARDDAVGRTVADVVVPPELRERHLEGLARNVAGGSSNLIGQHVEMPAVRKSGERFPAEISLARVPGAEPPVFVAYVRDVTGRKRMEQQLLQSQKMESVGRLAGGIAHDFNNILTAILGYADLILAGMGETAWRDDVEEIKHSAERAALLTRQLLAFGRRQVLVPQVVDVNDLVSDLERMLRRLIGEDIALTTHLAPDVRLVSVDPTQFAQAVMNLVVNARDAMPRGGRLTIETANVTLDQSYADRRSDAQAGEFVMIAVSDNGMGMTEEVQSHLFEPFYTTKERGKGTGLGLSTAYGIVKQSGGHMAVYSQVGQGSTFKIYLPITDEPRTAPAAAPAPARHGHETILLVEDEDAVRALARRVLESHGYTVLEAASAEEGRRIWNARKEDIDLLLTDVVLPGQSGPVLARDIRQECPDLRVLYTSGYSEAMIVQRGVLDPDTPYLQKPFAPATLNRKVRSVLDA